MRIIEDVCLGKDIGIASNGWAVLDLASNKITGAGVRLFDAPETDKEKTPKNQIRREKRGLRRTISRRASRMSKIRELCNLHGLCDDKSKELFQKLLTKINQETPPKDLPPGGVTPWSLRSDALERKLLPAELAVVLGHVTKHAGFQSNRKGGEKNVAGEDQKALKAMEGLASQIGRYRTFGAALFKDPDLSKRKRNREGIYDRMPKRDWLRAELSIIFEEQRKFRNEFATKELEDEFCQIAFSRLPLQDSEALLRDCPFEANEKRASKYSPSFERFRFLQSLAHLRIDDPQRGRNSLSAEEISKIEAEFAKTQKLSFKKLRTLLKLSVDGRFRGIPLDGEGQDVAARKKEGAKGTYTLRKILGDVYDTLDSALIDEAMAKISFRETEDSVRKGLTDIGLPSRAVELLMSAVEENEFSFATGAGHISAKACRNIIPGLRLGRTYSEACELAGYDHTSPDQSPFVRLRREMQDANLTEKRKAIISVLANPQISPINSPVARKAAIESVKQFTTLCHEHPALAGNLPGQVNIELAREVGKSPEERQQISSGIERRNRKLDRLAEQFEDTFGRAPKKGEVRMWELAQEQGWQCLYTGDHIDPNHLFDGISYQLDHILPWSRFGDNSYNNLTLCTAWANQHKKNRTPHEWMVDEGHDWEAYTVRVESRPNPKEEGGMKGIKKRNYLLKDAKAKEESFRERNLNDTKWAAKVIRQAIEVFYPIELNEKGNPIRRVRARPGAVTSMLRNAWGLNSLKKDEKGNRVDDDRHHALDAIVVAATSEAMLNRLTRATQQAEKLGKPRPYEAVEPPWDLFRNEVINALAGIVCSRAERRRARGEGHEATIRSYNPETGDVFVRETPEKLAAWAMKKANGDSSNYETILEERFERPERSKVIIAAIAGWARREMPKDDPPLGPTGDTIGKVRVIDPGKKHAVPLGEKATADRSAMVRTDVFTKRDKNGIEKFYLVPVYTHEVMDKCDFSVPPSKAIVANKTEADWLQMTDEFDFQFSLFPLSWVEVITSKGEVISGYFRTTDRNTNSIAISPHHSLQVVRKSIGARSLLGFKKFSVDRLGNKSEITSEPRMWHGVEYIFPNPPD